MMQVIANGHTLFTIGTQRVQRRVWLRCVMWEQISTAGWTWKRELHAQAVGCQGVATQARGGPWEKPGSLYPFKIPIQEWELTANS